MVVAVSLLWQPRVGSRAMGTPPLQLQPQLTAEKGQTPRGSLLQRQAMEDRLPQGIGALFAPPLTDLPRPQSGARRLESLPKVMVRTKSVEGLPQPRAPPSRYTII